MCAKQGQTNIPTQFYVSPSGTTLGSFDLREGITYRCIASLYVDTRCDSQRSQSILNLVYGENSNVTQYKALEPRTPNAFKWRH